jgi:hypothetical protein
MPKVVVSKSKGLIQQTGEGFELEDVSLKPSIETCVHSSTTILAVADVGDSLDGLYFDISSTTASYRVWFDVDNSGTAAPAAEGRTLIEVTTLATDDAAAAVAGKLETAIEAINGGDDFEVDDSAADGNFTIYGKVPGKTSTAASAGTSGFTLVNDSRGSGQTALSLDKMVSVIQAPALGEGNAAMIVDGQAANLNKYTLADGTYVGQRKLIIRDDLMDVAVNVAVAKGHDDDGGELMAPEDVVFVASTSGAMPRILNLVWSGLGWARLNPVTQAAGTTGLNS